MRAAYTIEHERSDEEEEIEFQIKWEHDGGEDEDDGAEEDDEDEE